MQSSASVTAGYQHSPTVKKDQHLTLSSFTSAFDIPAGSWDRIAEAGDNFYLSTPYLSILEKHPCESMLFHYVLACRGNEPSGILYFQETDIHIINGGENLDFSRGAVNRKWVSSLLQSLTLRLLVNGNLLVSGPHGAVFLPDVPDDMRARIVHRACCEILSAPRSGCKIHGVLIKDIDHGLERGLRGIDEAFTGFQVEPGMIIPIRRQWSGFDDVLRDYKSKYRVRARSALKKAASLQVRELDEKNVCVLTNRMLELFQNVAGRSHFHMMSLHPGYFPAMKTALRELFVVKGFFDGEQLVGFYSYTRGTGRNLAGFVGFDYDCNKTCLLYQNMLYALLDDAVRDNVNFLDLGRTALEIKSTVGAEPVDYRLLVKHLNGMSNTLLKKLIQNFQPAAWIQRKPFKDNTAAGHNAAALPSEISAHRRP